MRALQPYESNPQGNRRNMKICHSRYKSSFDQFSVFKDNQLEICQNLKTEYPKNEYSNFSNSMKFAQFNQIPSQELSDGNFMNNSMMKPNFPAKKDYPELFHKKYLYEHKKSEENILTACGSSESLFSLKTASSVSSNKEIPEEINSTSSFSLYHKDSTKKKKLEENLGRGKKQGRCYYNKFNTPNENIKNENTVILTLKVKVGPNDYRIFNLKKFDDLFGTLQKFFCINNIKQELTKPIVNKIFTALNQIFWVMNNKIGIYDKEYLSSLYKVWTKNKGKFPKTSRQNSVDEDSKDKMKIIQPYKSFTAGFTEISNGKNKKEKRNNSF